MRVTKARAAGLALLGALATGCSSESRPAAQGPPPAPGAGDGSAPAAAADAEFSRRSHERAYIDNGMVGGGEAYQKWAQLCQKMLGPDVRRSLPENMQPLAEQFLHIVEETRARRAEDVELGRALSRDLGGEELPTAYDLGSLVQSRTNFFDGLDAPPEVRFGLLVEASASLDKMFIDVSRDAHASRTLHLQGARDVAQRAVDSEPERKEFWEGLAKAFRDALPEGPNSGEETQGTFAHAKAAPVQPRATDLPAATTVYRHLTLSNGAARGGLQPV